MEKTVEYLNGKGIELSLPPMVRGNTKRAEISDPDGFLIELRRW
jgi:hypothetical protein